MRSKRLLRTAFARALACGSIGFAFMTGSARADVVTYDSTLSQANRLSLFHDYSIDAVGQVSGDVAGSPGGGVVSFLLNKWTSSDTTGTGRSLEINVSPVGGYDSNPEARRYHTGGEFGGADLNAAYRFDFGPDNATIGHPGEIKIFYDAVGAVYTGPVFKADTLQQTAGVNFHRSLFDNTLVVDLKISDQFTMEHGEGFLNTADAAPSVEMFLLPQSSVEFGYDYSRLDFGFVKQLYSNPDTNRHTLSVKYHFYGTPQKAGTPPESPDVLGDILRQSLYRATVGYDYIFNRAAGQDYLYEGDRVFVGFEGVQLPGAPDISLDARYGHEWARYNDPNYEGPTVIAGGPKGRKRADHIDVLTTRANARLFDLPDNRGTLSTFAQFDIIADRSLIAARHFNEYVVSAGISYRY